MTIHNTKIGVLPSFKSNYLCLVHVLLKIMHFRGNYMIDLFTKSMMGVILNIYTIYTLYNDALKIVQGLASRSLSVICLEPTFEYSIKRISLQKQILQMCYILKNDMEQL